MLAVLEKDPHVALSSINVKGGARLGIKEYYVDQEDLVFVINGLDSRQ